MNQYDAERAPDADRWLELDETERLHLVQDYHRRQHMKAEQLEVHSAVQVIVENQLAMNVDAVMRTMERLRREGLSRHDALHAIASVLLEFMHGLATRGTNADPGAIESVYHARLEQLTAKQWLG